MPYYRVQASREERWLATDTLIVEAEGPGPASLRVAIAAGNYERESGTDDLTFIESITAYALDEPEEVDAAYAVPLLMGTNGDA